MDLRRHLGALLDATPPASRPTTRASAPFVGFGMLGMSTLLLPPYPLGAGHVVTAVGVSVVLLAAHLASVRRSRRTWLDLVAPFGAFLLVGILRDATGGGASGLAPLVAVPLFWLALYGTRRDLTGAALLVVLTLLLPVILVGEPAYPVGEWRRVLVWAAVAVVIAPAVQAVVRRLEIETQRSRDGAARVESIVRDATLTSLITTDAHGRIATFSTGAEQELGYRAGDVIGKELVPLLLVGGELREVAAELGVDVGFAVLARLAHERSPSRIWTVMRADGRRAYVRMAVTELRDDQDRVTGYLCIAIDATSAIESQRALTFAEERWRVLMDHLPDTTLVMVEEGTGITVVTGAGVLARRLRDSAGRRLTEIVDHEVPGTLERMLEEAFAGREVSPVQARVGDLEHEFVASPLPSPGDKRQAIVMVRDVSEGRRRERSLTEAKERAERLFDDAPQGIALLRPHGVVVQVNPALESLLGAGLVGRPLEALSFAESDPTVDQHLRRVLGAPGHRDETQWSVRGSDGQELHVVLTSTMLARSETVVGSEDLVLTNVVDVSERYRYERRLAFLAEHDPLTGLANRRRFDQQLARHVEDCRRYGPRGAVLVLDLDNFKEVNDTLGHATGDQVLRDVSRVLSQRMRSSDLVARLGGDEFAILLPYADLKAAELVAADVVARIRDEARAHDDSRGQVSVSLGGAIVEPVHASGSELLSAADAAMYVAKNSGRNRYTFLSVRTP